MYILTTGIKHFCRQGRVGQGKMQIIYLIMKIEKAFYIPGKKHPCGLPVCSDVCNAVNPQQKSEIGLKHTILIVQQCTVTIVMCQTIEYGTKKL